MRVGQEELGTVGRDEQATFVRFERHLDAPPEAVWRALTEPAELAGWMAEATIDARVGGRLELNFADGSISGAITAFEPLRVLAYSWHEQDSGGSHVRFELEPDGAGTRLTLLHTGLPEEHAAGFGAGWHHHLELLAAQAAGAPIEWSWHRFGELTPRYEEALTA